MKMNWGWGITLVIIAFMGFILYLVFMATKQKVELVSEDYYALEINYDQQRHAMANALQYEEELVIQQKGDLVMLEIPQDLVDKHTNIQVHWYLAHDAKGDFSQDLGKVDESVNWLSTENLRQGNKYKATVVVSEGEKKYQFERIFYPA